jgi:hypothetical protein
VHSSADDDAAVDRNATVEGGCTGYRNTSAGHKLASFEATVLVNSAACQLKLGSEEDMQGRAERAKHCVTVLDRALLLQPGNHKALLRFRG